MVTSLTLNQCRQLKVNGYSVRDFVQLIDEQPEFIKEAGAIDSVCELHAIQQGGCASGAYMPAVTYYTANRVMSQHGDAVLEYIENGFGELPSPPAGDSWSGLAVFYLSMAVELWCNQFDLDGVDWD